MPTELWKQIEEALLAIVKDGPEEAIKRDEFDNYILDICFIKDDEINLTEVAKAVAEALSAKAGGD